MTSRYSITVPLLAIAVFLFAMWQFTSAIDEREFHRDEARWIHRGEYVRELGDPFSDYWDESTWADGASLDERNRLRAQPPVGSYLMGIGFLLQGKPLPDIGYWNMDHDSEWNAAHGNLPDDEMLTTARRTTSTLAALTAVCVFLIGTRLTHPLAAIAGAALFSLHPLARYLATFAGSDAALVLSIALAALCAARLAERPTWPRAVLLGAVIGLGGGVKLSPLGIAAALAMVGLVLVVSRFGRHRRLGVMLVSTPFFAALTFVASYPYLWRDPIGNSLNILRYRSMSFDLQGELWGQVAVETRMEAVERIWHRFASSEWSVLGRLSGWSIPIDNVLALIGVGILLWLVVRRGLASAAGLICVVLGASTAITVFGLEVDWARYHFPILLTMTVCEGVALGWMGTSLVRKTKTVRRVSPADGTLVQTR